MPRKYKQIKVNFTPEDHSRISQLAKAENLTIAQYIRSRLDSQIKDAPSPNRAVIYKRADPKLLYQLSRIGSNINQLARKVNQNQGLERRALLKIYVKVMQL